MAKSTRRARRGVRGDVMEMWQAPKQSWPAQAFGIVLRWRAELLLATVLIVAVVWLSHLVGDLGAWLMLAGTLVALVLLRPTRWFLYTRMWCLLDRHRIRTCLRNAKYRTMTLDGSYPFMLWARPTKTGERVWMWTRAGSSAEDLENVLDKLAPACFAREARLVVRKSLSTLVMVDIIRRDPLDRSTPVDSPLATVTSLLARTKTVGEGTEPIVAAPVTPRPSRATVTPAESTPATTSARKAKPAEQAGRASGSVVVNGEDLTDYID